LLDIAGAALASSFVLGNSVPIYLSMFVRRIFYLTWGRNDLTDFDEIWLARAAGPPLGQ